MAKYVIAVKRTRRDSGASTDPVRLVPGVKVTGGDAARLIVEASATTIEAVRGRFSADLHVEPLVSHQAS